MEQLNLQSQDFISNTFITEMLLELTFQTVHSKNTFTLM